MTEERLYELTKSLPPSEQQAFLECECADNPELLQRLKGQLDALNGAAINEPTIATPQLEGSITPTQEEKIPAVVVGRYNLIEKIGEGGMGSVWRAEQFEPVKRHVALKLVRADRGFSKAVLNRFEAERQAIALMDHPNIAKLLDAGTTEDNSPFFVMELVKGVPLTNYCDRNRLTIHERLSIFQQICLAVHHAHQKGILHRDLKPSNILVEEVNGKPVPKVIDFGLAKAFSEVKLTDESLHTNFGSVLGTPLYMAPEQAQFGNGDVDIRADVYALGVILYELLVGITPLDQETVRSLPLDELLRLIREQDPPLPSARVGSILLRETVSDSRQTDPNRLTRFLRGELDWITMKALAKQRDMRYDTAKNLAEDIERYLKHEPVLASPPSNLYLLRKFVRRNRPQVITAFLVFVALVAGIIGTTLGLIEARKQANDAKNKTILAENETKEKEAALILAQKETQEKEAALIVAQQQTKLAEQETLAKEAALKLEKERAESEKKAKEEAVLRKTEADTERQKAVTEKQIANSVKFFLQYKLLRQNDTRFRAFGLGQTLGGALGSQPPTLRELLDEAAKELTEEQIEKNFPKQPVVQAELLSTLADTYLGIGEAKTAVAFAERALKLQQAHLGPNTRETLWSRVRLAGALFEDSQHQKAIQEYEGVFEDQKKLLGIDDVDTLTTQNNLGRCYIPTREIGKAVKLLENLNEVVTKKMGVENAETIAVRNNLAQAYNYSGRPDAAKKIIEPLVDIATKTLGKTHPDAIMCRCNYALVQRELGDYTVAIREYKKCLELMEEINYHDRPQAWIVKQALGMSYLHKGDTESAFSCVQEAREKQLKKLGKNHFDTLTSGDTLGQVYQMQGRKEDAVVLLEEIYTLRTKHLGAEHPDTLMTTTHFAMALRSVGRVKEAIPLMEKVREVQTKELGAENKMTLATINSLTLAYKSVGRTQEAVDLGEKLLHSCDKLFGETNSRTIITLNNLALAYGENRQFEKAAQTHEKAVRRLAEVDHEHSDVISIFNDFFGALDRVAWYEQSEKERKAWLKIIEKKIGNQNPYYASQMVNLAQTQLRLKKAKDAETTINDVMPLLKKVAANQWGIDNAKAILGEALIRQGKEKEGEALLVEGYGGLKKKEAQIAPHMRYRLIESCDRLIEFYTQSKKPDEVKKYTAEKLLYKELGPRPAIKLD